MSSNHVSLADQQDFIASLREDPAAVVFEIGRRRPALVVVDASDAAAVHAAGKWGPAYAKDDYTAYATNDRKGPMHRWLLGVTERSQHVDHRSGNGLDNRRVNLRLASHSQNMMNRHKRKAGTSRYKGVQFVTSAGVWKAWIGYTDSDGVQRRRYLGSFHDEVLAAWAYDQAARDLFGEFARVNGVDDPGPQPRRFKQPYDEATKAEAIRLALKYKNCKMAAADLGIDFNIVRVWMGNAGIDISAWRNLPREERYGFVEPEPPDGMPEHMHGRPSGYTRWRCRCSKCLGWYRAYWKQYRADRAT